MTKIRAGQAPPPPTRARLDERCFDSHDALVSDEAMREEVRKVARPVVQAVKELRAGGSAGRTCSSSGPARSELPNAL